MDKKIELTENQQKIIDTIMDEFARINQPVKKDGLIDVGAIKSAVDAEMDRKRFITSLKRKNNENISAQILFDINLVRDDLKQLGLSVRHIDDSMEISIFGDTNSLYYIDYKGTFVRDKDFGDEIPTGFKIIPRHPFSKKEYSTISEAISSDDVVAEITRLYRRSQEALIK